MSPQIKAAKVSRLRTVQETAVSRPHLRWTLLVATLVGILCLSTIAIAVLLERGFAPAPILALRMREAGRWIPKLTAIVIFTVTYFAVAFGGLPFGIVCP